MPSAVFGTDRVGPPANKADALVLRLRAPAVQSQEKGHVCGEPQAEGILEALAAAGWHVGKTLEVRFHYMDYYGVNAAPEALHAAMNVAQMTRMTFTDQSGTQFRPSPLGQIYATK